VFNRSDSYSFGGGISGPGQVVQAGSGQTVLTAASNYTGATTVLAGPLTVNGSLVFAAASLYMVEAQGNTADRTNVSGTATLAGTVAISYLGGNLRRNYTILSAAAGRNGTFDSIVAPN